MATTQFDFNKSRVYRLNLESRLVDIQEHSCSDEENPQSQEQSWDNTIRTPISLHIEQRSETISSLYFTNSQNEIVDLPQEIVVKKYKIPTEKHMVFPIRPKSYNLFYAYNYEIYWNDTLVLLLEVQKIWNIVDMRPNEILYLHHPIVY